MSALWYLQVCSLANRLRVQGRRLRQPKYLAGAVAGVAYFYFFLVRGFGGARGGGDAGVGSGVPAEWAMLAEAAGAALLAGLVFLTWFFPEGRASLDFTEAEIAFLFPAPMTRRGLIHYRLLRTQVPLLFGALVMVFLTGRMARGGQAWMHWLGWWVVLGALELHRLGAAFTRTRLADRGWTPWRRRAVVAGLAGLFCLAFYAWAVAVWPPVSAGDLADARSVGEYARGLAGSGPMYWLLLPLRWLVRPMLAGSVGDFGLALGMALAVLGVLYVWVLRSQVSFEDESIERAGKRAQAVAAVRSGNWHLAGGARKVAAPFRLEPMGTPAMALVWKNLIAMGAAFSIRFWLPLAVCLVVGASVARGFYHESAGLKVVGVLPVALLPMLFLVGPQLLAMDLRQDLAMADLLKTYPLRGWQLVWGELLAPAAVLTGIGWLLIGLGVALFPETKASGEWQVWGRLAVGVGLAVVAPGLNLISLAIHNATTLLFPAWARPRSGVANQGFEATGRQMLLMIGQVLMLTVALVPAALVFGLVLWVGRLWVPWLVLLPGGALLVLGVLLAEMHAAARMLGDLFERMDLSREVPA